MNIERFCVKFFARPETNLDDAVFIEIFHEWIRLKTLPGILLDVADYRHVPFGEIEPFLYTHPERAAEIGHGGTDGARLFAHLAEALAQA